MHRCSSFHTWELNHCFQSSAGRAGTSVSHLTTGAVRRIPHLGADQYPPFLSFTSFGHAAPASIHCLSSSSSSAESAANVSRLSLGGIIKPTSELEAADSSKLSWLRPGESASPKSPPRNSIRLCPLGRLHAPLTAPPPAQVLAANENAVDYRCGNAFTWQHAR
jgi:hypothetical protein